MDLKSQFRSLTVKVAEYIPDDVLRIESVKRQQNTSGEVVPDEAAPNSIEIAEWKEAINKTHDQEDPRRHNLQKIYAGAMYDTTLHSCVTTRELKAVRTKWKVMKNGDHIPELLDLFRAPWFDRALRYAMTERAWGTGLLEITELKDDGAIHKLTPIPRTNFCPIRKQIFKQVDDDKGIPYDSARMAPYYIQVGDDNSLGLLEKAVPMSLAKKFAMSAWQLTQKRYGIPYMYITTNSQDKKRKKVLGSILAGMGKAGWGVFTKDEEFHLVEMSKSDPHKVFDECVIRCNSESAKLILGTDTVNNSDSKGTYGSMAILNQVSDDRHWADIQFMEHWLNEELLPRLVEISPYYAALRDCRLEPDMSEELSPKELIDSVSKLANNFEFDPEELSNRLGFTIISQRSSGYAPQKEDPADPKNPKDPGGDPEGK